MLEDANESGLTGTLKWELRERGGVYLDHYPSHSGNVALILHLQTGHISHQYHMVYDNEFTTVKYIESGEEPPNWCNLVEDLSEKVTDGKYNLARTWYASETKADHHRVHVDALVGEHGNGIIYEVRDISEQKDSDYSKPSLIQELVNLLNVGLRHSGRIKKFKGNQAILNISTGSYVLMVMVNQVQSEINEYVKVAYHAYLEGYNGYLDRYFDVIQNLMSIIGKIYLSGKINYKIYTLKDVL